jgi:tyrosyl-tRNA synthetase
VQRAYGQPPQAVITHPLLVGTDGVEKMSKSLGNYIGVTEAPESMYAKVMSISDDLMWRYYTLLTDRGPEAIEAERAQGTPMPSKMALGRQIVSDFHGDDEASRAEAEWKRVHQSGEAPSDLEVIEVEPGSHRPHHLVVKAGLAKSNGEAVRLLRQRAVRRDNVVLDFKGDIELAPGESFVLSVGAKRHVRIQA